ncbi:MAG: ABC transporter substrate-binding protein [Nitrospirae bacterium]|nr:ABC transporter substrate-binding protein [Nitrospirota bacterium]
MSVYESICRFKALRTCRITFLPVAVFLSFLIFAGCSRTNSDTSSTAGNADTIRIGVIAELTGDIPSVGSSSRAAAEMAVNQVNNAGGLTVGGRKLKVELFVEDDAAKADQAAATMQNLINQKNVIAVVGPNSSTGAIPAAEIAESSKMLMITPWSTNPKTTLDSRTNQHKRYVFRACYLDTFQGRILASFARNDLKAQKAAVLFDVAAEALKGQAEVFKDSFELKNGRMAGYEIYTTGDRDFSTQLTKIKSKAPDIIFLPAYYGDVPLAVQQAHKLGLNVPFLGSDAWASSDLLALCGKDCEGFYFTAHYSPDSAAAKSKEFVDKFKALNNGKVPDDVAALTYDAFGLLLDAIGRAGKTDTESVRNALANTTGFAGVTGNMKFVEGSGDPIKGAVILRIKDGKFKWFANANP